MPPEDADIEVAADLRQTDQKRRICLRAALSLQSGPFYRLLHSKRGQVLFGPLIAHSAHSTVVRQETQSVAESLIHNEEISLVATASRQNLIDVAVARGCRHYAAFASGSAVGHLAGVHSELIGVGLLRGELPEAFDSIRIGVMLLSHPSLNPLRIWVTAHRLGVGDRVRYVADVAVAGAVKHPVWASLRMFPPSVTAESGLPGLSRFVSETRFPVPSKTWLQPANLIGATQVSEQ